MIALHNILTPERCRVTVPGVSKKRVLEYIAKLCVRDLQGVDEQSIFENLVAREKLGSTGFGNGIAIPHCRLEGCNAPLSALLQLDTAIDYDALDGEPVDLLFVLLVPQKATEMHLELLKQIASLLDCSEIREQLRAAPDSQTLYRVIAEAQG